MRPSLLDRVDLAAVGAAARVGAGPWATVVACLLAPGVVQHDPTDAQWPDRDRLVVGDPEAAGALEAGMVAGGHAPGTAWFDATDGHALALARGMAAASELDGGIFRAWCLLGERGFGEGATWEAAVDAPCGSLVVVAVASPASAGRLGALLATGGWRVARARSHEPAELLGGLDQALLGDRPGALVATVSGP